ncbi:hypothetical protein WMY93_015850 [Mugilogobius chulae]|uniref:Myb/SANT-like DNA-binding domain-containing protein n=1 Tax=Mugilogobius chulae TaxID=88201 RepID=A0AAW0P3G6_9GOBI
MRTHTGDNSAFTCSRKLGKTSLNHGLNAAGVEISARKLGRKCWSPNFPTDVVDNATSCATVYADDKRRLFLDKARTQPLNSPLYQAPGHPEPEDIYAAYTPYVSTSPAPHSNNVMYFNASSNVSSPIPSPVAPSSSMPSLVAHSSPLPPNVVFTRPQTLYFIELIRSHLLKEGKGLPKSLAELNSRMRKKKGQKRLLWEEMAAKLTEKFNERFDFERVARKWGTLEEAYKNVVDNNRATGPIKFKFFQEMNDLLGDNDDVSYPVTATATGVQVPRPEGISDSTSSPSCSEMGSDQTQPPFKSFTKQKNKKLIEYLNNTEMSTQVRHYELMQQMKSSQESLEKLMTALIEKN